MPHFSIACWRQIIHTVSPGKMILKSTFALYRWEKQPSQEHFQNLMSIRL